MVRIKKQYKQPDGTLIEVEGTEEEIERFEKKQRKQKESNEQAERKKTILYGRDLEEIRKIVKEELAKMPRPVTYEYKYIYQQPWWQPTWTLGPVVTGISTVGQASGNSNWYASTTTNSDACSNYTLTTSAAAEGSITANAVDLSAYQPKLTSKLDVASGVINAGILNSNSVNNLIGNSSVSTWGAANSTNYLMSPEM